ncbi:MAG: CotH kinase family protein [Byssovorax sp.]
MITRPLALPLLGAALALGAALSGSTLGCGDAGSPTGTGGSSATTTTTSTTATTTTGTGGAGGSVTTGTGGSGGSEEPPDFAKAFPQDKVVRLDITITKASWQAMIDDLTALAGPFGGGSGSGGSGGAGGAGGSGASGGSGGAGGASQSIDGNPIYVDCDVENGEKTFHHVGIRFKGNASLLDPWTKGIWKLPLRLRFDEFEDTFPETKNQRYYGFQDLSLFNGAGDPSLLREKMAGDIFNDAAIPVPSSAFFRVYVDHGDGPQYFGLYTGIELPSDDAFLEAAFTTHKYDLYAPDGIGGTWSVWDEKTLGKQNNKGDYAAAHALFDALHADRSDMAAWRAGLDARLDTDGFLHMLAVNTILQDGDTYGLVPHNYYLYAGKVGRFTWIPWNHGQAFHPELGSLSLGLGEVDEGWPLIRYLADDPVLYNVYKKYLAQTVSHEYEPAAAEQRFTKAHDLIKPYVIGPDGEVPGSTFITSEAEFDGAVADLIAHAKQRKLDVDAFLAP